jgi:peptidoglycan/LPS O-acetylase OafA/YrhL
LSDRSNALNFVRLVLASGVIVSHAWPLTGAGSSPLPGGLSIGGWCVSGFFAASGYLVAGSRMRLSFDAYLVRRAMRIVPGLWFCLLVTAFVLAPLSVVLDSGSDRLELASQLGYVWRNLGVWSVQGSIDFTLGSIPEAGLWNGSLWTLGYEFLAYLALGGLFAVVRGSRARQVAVAAGFALTSAANLVFEVRGSSNGFITLSTWLACFFLAGAVFRVLGERTRATAPAALAAVVVVAAAVALDLPRTLAPLAVAYLVLWAGSVLPTRIGSRNDISYGVYVYAFPIGQLVVLAPATHDLSVPQHVLITFLLTLPMAWISWTVVERPAIRRSTAVATWVGRRLASPEVPAPTR